MNVEPKSFGLDLSDLTLKIVQLEKRDSFLRLRSFLKKEMPEGLIVKGEIKDEKKVSKVLQEALGKVKGKPIRTKYVNLALPEEKVFTKVVRLPKMKPEEVAKAIKWEAEANIPIESELVYLGWEIIETPISTPHLDVFIAACPKEIIDSYLRVLKGAGLQATAFEPESTAICRCLVKPSEASQTRLIVDLGAVWTKVVVFFNRALRFTRNVPISLEDFTKAIARELKIARNEAEEIKIKYGLDKTKMQGKIFNALIPILTRLCEQIQKSITFYQEHSTHEHAKDGFIYKVILCGGGARLKGLIPFLGSHLKKKVELANPWKNVIPMGSKKAKISSPRVTIIPLSKSESLAYTTAIGLALRKIEI